MMQFYSTHFAMAREISTSPFLLRHFSPGDKIENCSSQFLAVCWIVHVEFKVHHHGVDLISDALRFGSLWYSGPNGVSNAIGFAKFYSRSHHAVIRVYDAAGDVIETHEHKGDFRDW
jgi:hypothetical protein